MVYDRESVDTNNESDVLEVTELKDIKEHLALYAKENENLVNELKELRHSTMNIIHGINGFIELEDWDGLKKYFNDILERAKNISDTRLSAVEKILNPSLKDLVYSKLKNALDLGLDTKVMVDRNILIESSLISETDLCKVVGEFLDNAIEAASAAAFKKVSIYFLSDKTSAGIIIENTFKEKPTIPLKNMGMAEAESRESGVQPASVILSKYPKVLNNTFIQHQVFIQELQILK